MLQALMQLTSDDLKIAYTKVRTIREFEERIRKELATGRIPGFVHLYAGEETSAVGVRMHLNGADHITSTHRGHGHCVGKGGSMHIADVSKGMLGTNGIVGGGPPLEQPIAPRQSCAEDAAAARFLDGGGSGAADNEPCEGLAQSDQFQRLSIIERTSVDDRFWPGADVP